MWAGARAARRCCREYYEKNEGEEEARRKKSNRGRRIAEEDVTRLTGTNIQPSLDRLEIDVPSRSTPDFSSTLPDVSAVKLNGIEPGRTKFSLCRL